MDAPADYYLIDTLLAACSRESVEWPLSKFGQNAPSMEPAIATFEALLIDGKLKHPGNPCLDWNAANAVVTETFAGDRRFDKPAATGRIDGMVAGVMASSRMDTHLENAQHEQVVIAL